jgi:hypothetical protein
MGGGTHAPDPLLRAIASTGDTATPDDSIHVEPLRRRGKGAVADLTGRVGYHDLMADLRKPGCPVCHGAHRSAWRLLGSILWESVNDPGVRAQLRSSKGFCAEHAGMALAVASAQSGASGIAILYEDFLRRAREEVVSASRDAAGRRGRSRRREGLEPAGRGCLACRSAGETASNYLEILSEARADSPPGRAVREPTRGLCLPHLAMGLDLARSSAAGARLVDVYLRGEADLRADLAEFVRKHDYRFRAEGFTSEEATSWVRAVHRMVGEPPPRRQPTR